MEGIQPSLSIEDEVDDLLAMSEILDAVKKKNDKLRADQSKKVNDKSDRRAKSRKAKASRKANRG